MRWPGSPINSSLCTIFQVVPCVVRFVSTALQAEKRYKAEHAKYGQTDNADLLKRAEQISTQSQLTAFESQLVRSLNKKTEDERNTALRKYTAIYSGLSQDAVLSQLMDAAHAVPSSSA